MLTKILVFTCYHCDDDRVRLSVKDFELYRAFSMRLVVGKKSNSVSVLITNWTRFSLFWSPSFDSQMFSSHGSFVFCDVATIKTLDIVWNHFWKRGKRPKKRRGGVFGKSQFCREKKNRKIKEEKKKQRKKARLVKFDFPVHGACQILVSISTKLHLKKNKCIYRFHLELQSRAE